MKKVYLVRHGQTSNNLHRIFGGQEDVVLTELGQDQARLAGRRLVEQGLAPDLIISSPLTRARQTAELIATELGYPVEKIEVDKRVTEINDGKMTGVQQTPENRQKRDGYALDEHNSMGVEWIGTMVARLDSFLADIGKRPEPVILVVSHSFAARMMMRLVEGLDQTTPMPKLNNSESMQLIPYAPLNPDGRTLIL